MSADDTMDQGSGRGFRYNDRRTFLKSVAGVGAAVSVAGCAGGGGSGDVDELNWLGWEHYAVDDINRSFEDEFDVTLNGSFFDANSSAYNTLQTGGADEFDVVMADGFWPQLYYEEDLIQPLDYGRLDNLEHLHDDFKPENFPLFRVDGEDIASPNCWGGYGVTYNTEKVDEADATSIESLLYNEKYQDHISTTGRQQINIANTGIMLGYDDPQGAVWEVCDEEPLNKVRDALITQKDLLVTRYASTSELEQLFRSGDVWAAPEWSGVYRRLFMDGEPYEHTLLFDEGGLGWVDTWMMTSGVESEAKRDLVYEWIDWRLDPENMAIEAEQVGWSPTIDIRGMVDDELATALFQDETEQIHKLTQFDTPQCPGKWEDTWNEVEQA